jgi:hypothetical protein
MNPDRFDQTRTSFRHAMIEKPLNELEAMLRTFERLNRMDSGQREALINDMRLMVSYKTRLDFDEMVKPMLVDWGSHEKTA